MKIRKRLLGLALCLCAAVCVNALLRTPAMAADTVIPAVNWQQETRSAEYGNSISTHGTQSTDWSSNKYVYTGTWYRCENLNKKNPTAVGELVLSEDSKVQLYYIPNNLELGVYYYYLEVTARDKSGNIVETNTSPVNTVTVIPATPTMNASGCVWPDAPTGKCGQTPSDLQFGSGCAVNPHNKAIVSGKFVGKDSSTKLTANDDRCAVIFIPNDEVRYNRITDASMRITVNHDWDEGKVTTEPTCTKKGKTTYTCIGCGATSTIKNVSALDHDYSVWDHDDDQHWKKCSRCDEIDGKTAHVYNQKVVDAKYLASAATCTSPAVYYKSCECGAKGTETFESGDKNPNNHSKSLSGWQVDFSNSPGKYHVRKYLCCGAIGETGEHEWGTGTIKTQPTCTEKGEMAYECSECTAGKEVDIPAKGHSWKTEWTSNGEGHWHECWNEGCNEKDQYGQHSGGTATCTAKAVCITCSTAYGEFDTNNHDYGTPAYNWIGTQCTAKRVCSRNSSHVDEEISTATVTVTQAQSCTLPELSTYTAKFTKGIFEEQKQTNIQTKDALGHDTVHHEAKAATCTAIGWNAYDTCSRCDYSTYKELSALGHDFVNGSYEHDNDSHWKKCSRCDATDTKDFHDWDSGKVTKEATCTTAGNKLYTCPTCGATKDETISAKGHDLVSHNAQAATCTAIGWEAYETCKRCDYTTYNEIAATGHTDGDPVTENRVEPTCTVDGSYDEVVYCTVCRTELRRTPKTIDAMGHALTHHDAQAATCTEKGWDAYDTCSRCNYTTYNEIAIDLSNHDFDGGTWKYNADKHWKECSRCDAAGPKTLHNFSKSGRTYTCTNCSYAYTVPSSSGSSSTPSITVPVTGSRDTVQVSANVSGSTAEVKEVKKAELDKIGTDSDVVIDLSGLSKRVTGVTLPTGTIRGISESDADGVTIKLPNAELRVDQQTLASVAEQAKGSKIQLVVETDSKAKSTMTAAQKSALNGMKNAAALEAYFVSNGQRIRDFNGGEVELSVPYQATGAIRAWYLKEDGTREPVSARYDKENARLILRHFSHYVIEELDSSTAYTVCAKDDTCPLAAFNDLTAAAWYHDGVHYCLENGLMQGVSTAEFLPDGSTTRAQLVTILWRLEGSPEMTGAVSFGDVADGAWYAKAVRWAAGSGVVKGYDSEHFGPDDAVTREQMVTILYRCAQYKGADVSVGEDTNILSFNDALTVSEYAIPAMQWACGSGLVTGIAQDGGMFLAPADTTVRVQTATLMMRFPGILAKTV